VSEACIIGVPDNDARNLCGAVIRVRQEDASEYPEVTLARIRLDLHNKLATYMLPTLLRKLANDETLPYTSSGKVARQETLRQFFNTTSGVPVNILPPSVERWEGPAVGSSRNGLWDECGFRQDY
jgi:malonyl-CoA/methylmalonyl-CoA synthetase